MKVGTVVGQVWATRRLNELPNGALLEIEFAEGPDESERSVETVVAYDPLGAGVGEHVMVTLGSVAKGWFSSGDSVVDALVIGIVDEKSN